MFTGIFGFVLTSILFLKKFSSAKATVFLGSFYLLLSFYTTHAYILDGGHFTISSWFFLWPLIPFNLFAVPIYFYFETIIEDEFRWRKRYLLLFIPFMVSVLDAGYIYLQPAEVFDNILEEAITNPTERLDVSYWLLDGDQHLLMRHVWQLAVLLIVFPKLRKFILEGKNDKLKGLLNKWLLVFWSSLVLFAILAILYALENRISSSVMDFLFQYKQNKILIPLVLYLIVFSIGIIPIYFPSILYGYPQRSKSFPKKRKEGQNNQMKFGLDEQMVAAKLSLLEGKKLYLDHNFTLSICAGELGMPAHHISYFLKKQYEKSFAEYRNGLRMEHAKSLIKAGFLDNNTVEALANECGFVSRTSFSSSFKAYLGKSPRNFVLEER